MFIRNINKFRAEKRYSAKTTSRDRKASCASKKSCSSWDRAEIRAGLNKYLTTIRKYHDDPFLAETDEPTLFDIILVWNAEDREFAEARRKQEEAEKIASEISKLHHERYEIQRKIAALAQERHLLFCDDDWCRDCTNTVEDCVTEIFYNY